jgi:hypothetical protein
MASEDSSMSIFECGEPSGPLTADELYKAGCPQNCCWCGPGGWDEEPATGTAMGAHIGRSESARAAPYSTATDARTGDGVVRPPVSCRDNGSRGTRTQTCCHVLQLSLVGVVVAEANQHAGRAGRRLSMA